MGLMDGYPFQRICGPHSERIISATTSAVRVTETPDDPEVAALALGPLVLAIGDLDGDELAATIAGATLLTELLVHVALRTGKPQSQIWREFLANRAALWA